MLSERDATFYAKGGWSDTIEYASYVVEQTIRDHDLQPCLLLDAACGDGRFGKEFHARGFTVTGFDISADAIAAANARFPGPSYVVADAEETLPWAREFGIVYCRGISHTGYERNDASDRVFENLHGTMAEDGLFILERNTDGSGVDGPSRYFPSMNMGNPTAEQLMGLLDPFFTGIDVLHLDGRIQVSARPR